MEETIGGIIGGLILLGGMAFGAYKKFGNGNGNGKKYREPREVKLSDHDTQLLRDINTTMRMFTVGQDTTNHRLGKIQDSIVELRVKVGEIQGRIE